MMTQSTGHALDQYLALLDRMKRWPDDGLHIYQREHQNPETQHDLPNPCEVQKKLTTLLGSWPLSERFADLDEDARLFYILLPYAIQTRTAHELADHSLAADHLFDVCEEPAPKNLLKDVGAYGAVKYGRRSFHSWGTEAGADSGTDAIRVDEHGYASMGPPGHHGINMILAKLVKYSKDSDENLQLLFGSEFAVLGALMEIRQVMLIDAPADSPAGMKQAELLDDQKLRPLLTCAHCGTQAQDGNYQICGGCHREVFCSQACVEAEWPVHCVDCLRAQGKPVSASKLARAQAEIERRQRAQQEQASAEEGERSAEMIRAVQEDLAQTSFSAAVVHDCFGVRRTMHLSEYYLNTMCVIIRRHVIGLACEESVRIVVPPSGALGDLFVVFRNTANGALVLLAFTPLYADHGEGAIRGIAIDAVYVVMSAAAAAVSTTDVGEVEWTAVPEPTGPHIISGCALLVSWLTEAQRRATVPTKDLYYRLGSTKSMKRSNGCVGP